MIFQGGVLVPFLQVSGRAFVLFAMIESEPRMQTKPVIFYLFLVWSFIEIVRYLFSHVLNNYVRAPGKARQVS